MYNREKTIERCILSALSQDYGNIEVLVVDDGSTDGSMDIVNKFSDQIVIVQKQNGGAASAKNYGAKIATGNYITFLDSDDYFQDEFVISRIMSSEIEFDFSYNSSMKKIFNSGEVIESIDYEPTENHLLESPLIYAGLPPYVFNKELYEISGGMDESVKWGDAISFWREYFKHCVVITKVNTVGYVYDLTGDDNVSKGGGKRNEYAKDAITKSFNSHYERMTKSQISNWLVFILLLNISTKDKDGCCKTAKLIFKNGFISFVMSIVRLSTVQVKKRLTK